MATTCDTNRQTPQDLEDLKKIIDEARITETDILGMTDILDDVAAEAAVRHLVGEVIPEEDIEEYIGKIYGKDKERYLLAIKIAAISAANPLLSDMIHEAIFTHMPTGRKRAEGNWGDRGLESAKSPLFGKGGLTQEKFDKLSDKKKLEQVLKVLPLSTLKIIYKKSWDWANATTGEKWAKGLVGNFLVQYHGPKQLALKEHTGAYFKMTKHLTRYYTDIEGDIGDFMYSRTIIRNGKEVKVLGMTDIFKAIEDFEDTTPNWEISKDIYNTKKEILTEFLIMNMTGEIYYDKKSGKFMAYNEFGTLRGEDGKAMIWSDTGRVMHGFSDPVSIDKFQNGRYNIKFSKKQVNEFLEIKKNAREIDDRLLKHAQKRHKASVEAMKNALQKHFPDLSLGEVNTLFFETFKIRSIVKIVTKMKAHDKAHKTDYYNKYTNFKNTFGTYISPSLFVNETSDIDLEVDEGTYKRNHFPVKYPPQIFKLMFDSYIKDLENKKRILKKRAGKYDEEVKAGKKFTKKQQDFFTELKQRLKDIESMLTRAYEISKNKDGIYPEDTVSGKQMTFVKDQKHLKTITNAFDVRNMRKDSGVYYDYLQEVFASINRNNLTTTLLESLLLSKSDAVDKTLINYYKVPFNDPSTVGGFGLIKWSDEGVSALLGKMKINIPASTINRINRLLSKILSGSMLGGWGTALVNKMAIAQTVQDHNMNEIRRVTAYMKKHKDEVEAFVAKSGVTAFADFFSRALINGKAGIELDNFTVEKIYAIMLNFPSLKVELSRLNITKLRSMAGNRKAYEKLSKDEMVTKVAKLEIQKQFNKVLKDSPNVKLVIKKILDKDSIDARLKKLSQSKIDNAVNKFVQYALSKEYEINRYAKVLNWKYSAPAVLYKGVGAILGTTGEWRQTFNATMSASESWIRTVSFLVGVLKAQDLGYIRNDVLPWKLTGKELQKAIEIGRLVSNYSNMGLSTTDVGAVAYGGIGNIMQKFNLWGLQKRGRDARVIKNAITVQKDLLNLGKSNLFDVKAIAKMIGKGSFNYWKFHDYDKMNLGQKETAQLYKFITIGVLPALILDLVVWGPLGGIVFLSLIKTIGQSTGFASSVRGLPSQLAQLLSIPLAFALRMAWGDDDDEEKTKQTTRFVSQYSRTLPFGFGMTYPMEWILFFFLVSNQGNESEAVRKGFDILRPLFIDNLQIKLLREGVSYLLEDD